MPENVLLTNEDYALLVDSVGLFLALAVAMLLTRRVDWHDVCDESAVVASPRATAQPQGWDGWD